MTTRLPVKVQSSNVKYDDENDVITSAYTYYYNHVQRDEWGQVIVSPQQAKFIFQTKTALPRMGLMIVGLGGNNGTTVTAGIIANREKITWRVKNKQRAQRSNFFGSLIMSSTVRLGFDENNNEVTAPLCDLIPFVDPTTIEVSGWDISGMNMADAMARAQVLDVTLQDELRPHMEHMVPLAGIYCEDFCAPNQRERADNVLTGTKYEMMEKVRQDIRTFRESNDLDTVIVIWSATTERYCEVIPGVHDSEEGLLNAARESHPELSPSTLYAMAAVLEGCAYINGAPQNTIVPGLVQMAARRGVFLGGDDFKSGQTKLKSVLADFLISSGLKPVSIVSYNHLGNNDGRNLSAPLQFRSKEISKAGVVEDLVASNPVLYAPGERPDHVVVIKYVPAVGDSKRAMDEYTSEIFMGGYNTIVIHNTCEDSLLAAPIILDLALMTELFQRVELRRVDPSGEVSEPTRLHPILTPLSFFLKAPLAPPNTPVVNAFFRQRACIENLLRALIGLPPENNMLLEYKLPGCEKGNPLAGLAVSMDRVLA